MRTQYYYVEVGIGHSVHLVTSDSFFDRLMSRFDTKITSQKYIFRIFM